MKPLIDLFAASPRKNNMQTSTFAILYRAYSKEGAKKPFQIKLYIRSDVLEALNWKHKDKVKVLTNGENFELKKTEKDGYAMNQKNKARGIIAFTANNPSIIFPADYQNIKEIQLDLQSGILAFSIHPFEIKIPDPEEN